MKLPTGETPIQPVEKPILCSPYEAPHVHWHCVTETREWIKVAARRPSRYYFKTKGDVKGQMTIIPDEAQEDLHMVNQIREDVARWRESNYEGVTPITRELLTFWASADRPRRLFFCQREAVETVVYLAEILRSGKRPRFNPKFPAADLARLVDPPAHPDLLPLTRFGCKMATGSGKTVVMSMLIAWAFCNRGRNPSDERFPNAVLVCCPNLTVKERLQVLRPERPDNYYAAFDIVPSKLRPLMQNGRVLVENWHTFAPASEHSEGGKSYAVVNKGAETPDAFARRVLGDLYDRMPIMVLNDEAHHCYRPAPMSEEQRKSLTTDELKQAAEENKEATVWVNGLDTLNNVEGGSAKGQTKPGIALCVDLSATPFYISGSGYPESSPFPWLVSDFGLVDAIESGIVKIPRLPVSDTTGRPEPRYFKLWENIKSDLAPADFLPGRARKPKPEVVYRQAEPALQKLASQWAERFKYITEATPGQVQAPPVLIVVCDNTEIAEVFYRRISGEEPLNAVTPEDVADADADGDADEAAGEKPRGGKKASRQKFTYGHGKVFPEHFGNTETIKRTIRIDSDLLAKAEADDPTVSTKDAAEALRRVVATVGKRGEPGEHVRCVVSVAMLTEGWDANNVTHILGLRAFGSQLLCEQVVGRGLRRMNYTPDPATGLLTEEYVDVYGIPFSLIPFKGRPIDKPEPIDKPKNHVRTLPERQQLEIRFPIVESYAFALRKNLITCNVEVMEPLVIEPGREPTATFVMPTVGYQEGSLSQSAPFGFNKQDRSHYYEHTHLHTIKFQIARLVVQRLCESTTGNGAKAAVMRLKSRHTLFPQVLRYVDQYVRRKVDFKGEHPCELGLERYVTRLVGYLADSIMPDEAEGEPPLLPILNRYKPIGSSAEVDFTTTRPCHGTQKSHVNQVVLDTLTWEASVAFRLEANPAVERYVRNDHLGLVIPYEFEGNDHTYQPDFIVGLRGGLTVLLEIKGEEDARDIAKAQAARRWVSAVNNAKEHGLWSFHVCRDPDLLDRELAAMPKSQADQHVSTG